MCKLSKALQIQIFCILSIYGIVFIANMYLQVYKETIQNMGLIQFTFKTFTMSISIFLFLQVIFTLSFFLPLWKDCSYIFLLVTKRTLTFYDKFEKQRLKADIGIFLDWIRTLYHDKLFNYLTYWMTLIQRRIRQVRFEKIFGTSFSNLFLLRYQNQF